MRGFQELFELASQHGALKTEQNYIATKIDELFSKLKDREEAEKKVEEKVDTLHKEALEKIEQSNA